MIKNYLKIAFRNLIRFKIYSFINIVGLAVGITCFITLSLFIIDETGYDTFNKGKIARNTLNDAVLILKNFKKICTELNINKIKAVATTAVRERV